MITVLNSNTESSQSKLNAVDLYLPLIWQLLNSLNNQAPVPIDRPLAFQWRGCLAEGLMFSNCKDIIFELIMTLHCRATLLYNSAAEMLVVDPTAVQAAGGRLREAAGIMHFLANNLV